MIGAPTLRREDDRMLRGRSRLVSALRSTDSSSPVLAAAFVRSPVAHARLRAVDVSVAMTMPGVVAVITGIDVESHCHEMEHRLSIPGVKPLSWPLLARDRVRYVGDPIAVVVATSTALAVDAADAVTFDIVELPVVTSAVTEADGHGVDADRLLFPAWGDNVMARLVTSVGDVDTVMATAPHRLNTEVTHHRIHGMPLEGPATMAAWDAVGRRLTVHASNQQPHQLRVVIAETLGLPESTVRVVAGDLGGGFGTKQHFTREECVVAFAAMHTGRTVRWCADSSEQLIIGPHARDQHHRVEAGYDDEGRVLALDVRIVADLGCPTLYFSGLGPPLVTAGSMPNAYAIESYRAELVGVATNKAPSGAYRGFGQPQAHLTMETVLDGIARELGIDPLVVRQRNLHDDGRARPFIAATGARLDIGPQRTLLDQAVDAFGLERWRAERDARRAAGRLMGIGMSCLVEAAAPTQLGVAGRFGAFEVAQVVIHPDGRCRVTVGTTSHGQGHETIYSQIAADVLGATIDDIDVCFGDTDVVAYGMGTWGSRAAVMGGGAVHRACETLSTKVRAIATHVFGEQRWTLADVARVAWHQPQLLPVGMAPGLAELTVYDPGNTSRAPDEHGRMNFNQTYSLAATIVTVEIDPDTAQLQILDAVMAHDCGVVINPLVLDGQLQGGFVQGFGAVVSERFVYDALGQPLTTTLADYLLPTMAEAPHLRVVHACTPSNLAGGFRGAAEGPIIAAPAAIVGAVNDALAPLGVRVDGDDVSPSALFALLGSQPRR